MRGEWRLPRTSDFPVPVEPKITTSGSVGGLVDAIVVMNVENWRIGLVKDVSEDNGGSLITETCSSEFPALFKFIHAYRQVRPGHLILGFMIVPF